MTCLGVDRVDPYHVTVVGLPCGSSVVSDCVLPVVWPFSSCYLLLRVRAFVSAWSFPCSYVVQRISY